MMLDYNVLDDQDQVQDDNHRKIFKSDIEMMELKDNKHTSDETNDSNNNTKLEEFDDTNKSATTILVLNSNGSGCGSGNVVSGCGNVVSGCGSSINNGRSRTNNDHNEEDHLQLSRLLSSNNNDGSNLQHDNNTPNDTDEVSLLFFFNSLF